jgi:hypothetical protein
MTTKLTLIEKIKITILIVAASIAIGSLYAAVHFIIKFW